jgi:hypothetical protein
MIRARLSIAWLAAAAMVAIITGGAAALASEDPAEVVPRADDVSLKLSIENIDGKVVNVPEATIRKIPPGDRYLGIKIEFRDVSGGALFSGLGVFSAIAGAASDKPPGHDGVSFTALPGRRYLVNGAMVDGKPKVWIEEELFEANQDDDRK